MVAENNGVVSLHGTARIPKREADICERIIELYEMGCLSVSFEIRYSPDNVVEMNGVSFVDAADENVLTGMAVVWTPAYADANALDLVAEADVDSESGNVAAENTSVEGDEKEVPNEEVIMTSEESVEVAAEEVKETETVVAEEVIEKEDDEKIEEKEEEKEEAQAEVLHHSVEVTERVEQCEGEAPIHVTEAREVVVETIDPQPVEVDPYQVIAEKDEKISALETEIAELKQIKEKYDAMVAEAQRAELEAKQNKMKAFAEKYGLDSESEAVKAIIASLDYEALVNMADEVKEEKTESVQVASYAIKTNMEINSEYGGLLERRG